MQNKLTKLTQQTLQAIANASSKEDLFAINTAILGRNGELSILMRGLKDLSNAERPSVGALMNKCRDDILHAMRDKEQQLDDIQLNDKLANEYVDVTMPVAPFLCGTRHPMELIQQDLIDYFVGLGFEVRDGNEIESDYYCFEALNIPKEHPARDAQDTFYFDPERVLRVHTSATQVRTMQSQCPPIKMISTGKVYRVDEIDATHSPIFHQFEILVVDEHLSVADLKGILDGLIKHLFGDKASIRLRPSFFPFTEPSVEVDATCPYCQGKGCHICKGSGYIEVLGAGMVNPIVLENCSIDSTKYTGFAAGLGLDRLAMIRYGMTDIRDLYDNDVNFLKQFK